MAVPMPTPAEAAQIAALASEYQTLVAERDFLHDMLAQQLNVSNSNMDGMVSENEQMIQTLREELGPKAHKVAASVQSSAQVTKSIRANQAAIETELSAVLEPNFVFPHPSTVTMPTPMHTMPTPSFDDAYVHSDYSDLQAMEKELEAKLARNVEEMKVVDEAMRGIKYGEMELLAGRMDAELMLPAVEYLVAECTERSFASDVLALFVDLIPLAKRTPAAAPSQAAWANSQNPAARTQNWAATDSSFAYSGQSQFGTAYLSRPIQEAPSNVKAPYSAQTSSKCWSSAESFEPSTEAGQEDDEVEEERSPIEVIAAWPRRRRHRGPNVNGSTRAARRKRRLREEAAAAAAAAEAAEAVEPPATAA